MTRLSSTMKRKQNEQPTNGMAVQGQIILVRAFAQPGIGKEKSHATMCRVPKGPLLWMRGNGLQVEVDSFSSH